MKVHFETLFAGLIWLVLSGPALAWDFTPGTPCLLTHETPDVAVKLTYDPSQPLYTISLTQQTPFIPASVFAVQFNGAMPISIATDRHQMSGDNRTVTAADSGFGNVLNGLQFNQTATATLGTQTITIPLTGAADPVAAFRACDVIATS